MTREMVENFIHWSLEGNSEDRFRRNEHLHLVLRLMYYSHIKHSYVDRLTPSDIKRNVDGTGEGYYTTMRGGEYMYYFQIRKEEMELLSAYIEKYNVKQDEPIIQIRRHAIRKVFREIAEVYKVQGIPKPQLKEVYFAGLSKD